MMKTSARLSVTAAASMLGVALAASGAYAAASALTTRDVPGQVLQVSGVGPASDHASPTAHANTGVKVPPVATTVPMAARPRVVGQVARPTPQTLPAYHPAMPQTTASTQPVVPQPIMSPGTNTPPSPMH
jgi:ABC-type transporter Mla subunit MlaD